MGRNREEEELLGAAGDVNNGVWVHDNLASTQIEDFDSFDPVDADENPFMPQIVDNDGVPGFRPFTQAANEFENPDELAMLDPEVPVEAAPDEAAMDSRSRGDSRVADAHLGDDLVERLQQHEQAAVGAGGSDDLVRLARVSQIQQQNFRDRAQWARVNPQSAPTALFGSSISLSTEDPPQQVALWTAESDIETQPVTITFVIPAREDMVESPVLLPPILPIRLVGKINFGTRVRYDAEVDVATGTILTLNASEASLAVGNDPSVARLRQLHPDWDINHANVGGMLSYWPCVSTAPLLRTRYVDELGAGATTLPLLAVPNFAKRLVVHRTPVASGITVQVFGSPTNSFSNLILEFTLAGGAIMTTPVDLPGDAISVSITNTSGVTIQARAIFELGL